MFGKKSLSEQYAKIIDEITNGKRRQPQHDYPAGLRGRYSEGKVDPVDQHFFDEATLLGPALDRHTADAWSFEEISDTMRRAKYLDFPDYGRRWTIYYNSLELGWMEASPAPDRLFGTVEEFVGSPMAQIDLELHNLRWVPSEDVYGLLYQIAFIMQGTAEGYDVARDRAGKTAVAAMTLYSWEVNRAGDEYVPSMEFSAMGPYGVYREMVAHWKETGFDVVAEVQAGLPFRRREP